jgi:hypothetical protein
MRTRRKRIGPLARFNFSKFLRDEAIMRLAKSLDRIPLRFEAQAGPALLLRADPDVGDKRAPPESRSRRTAMAHFSGPQPTIINGGENRPARLRPPLRLNLRKPHTYRVRVLNYTLHLPSHLICPLTVAEQKSKSPKPKEASPQ